MIEPGKGDRARIELGHSIDWVASKLGRFERLLRAEMVVRSDEQIALGIRPMSGMLLGVSNRRDLTTVVVTGDRKHRNIDLREVMAVK
ncbi:hypothetical protein OIK40_14480 [Erythrobacter sp. sf7]|uniref:Uncharacterized protein n=1 Tax=Erythrobacter fulvus TaxID=2987523 RepID=A0ABT5JSX0_9SPHN|nr:hypothetical protein [Erythrobacter fulvus]